MLPHFVQGIEAVHQNDGLPPQAVGSQGSCLVKLQGLV